MGKEAKLQGEIIRWLKRQGCYVAKMSAGVGVSTGCPDICAVYKSMAVFIEVKTDEGRFQPLQVETIAMLSKHGFAYVVSPSNWANVRQRLGCILAAADSIIGRKFGRLKVIGYDLELTVAKNKVYLKCLCDCGRETSRGKARFSRASENASCGCWGKENAVAMGKKAGEKLRDERFLGGRTRVSSIWYDMKQRCYNEKCANYRFYGAKGIKVCDEWHDREVFLDWAFESGYEGSLTIDRIDNRKGYSPENCRWATKYEQTQNKSGLLSISYMGKEYRVKELSSVTGVGEETIRRRYWLGYRGESLVREGNLRARLYAYHDKEYSLEELSLISGIEKKCLEWRLKQPTWSVERAVETPSRKGHKDA